MGRGVGRGVGRASGQEERSQEDQARRSAGADNADLAARQSAPNIHSCPDARVRILHANRAKALAHDLCSARHFDCGSERMRCAYGPVVRVAQYALPVLLILASAPSGASAQSLVCEPIRRGESAVHAARRLTGDGRNTYQASFQIMNGASRFIPKSQYNRVRAGWRACVLKPAVQDAVAQAERVAARGASVAIADATPEVTKPVAVAAPIQAPEQSDSALSAGTTHRPALPVRASVVAELLLVATRGDFVGVWLAMGLVVPWFGWRIVDRHLTRRKTMTLVMRHFAHRFVDEFERPLRYDARQRAVRSQLRFNLQHDRFDILLTPCAGRRYPNLSDHKKNVEYDLARVMQMLADRSFAYGKPYMRGRWVVVPFRFTADRKPTGVSCISSL